jgi:hypothetical protein
LPASDRSPAGLRFFDSAMTASPGVMGEASNARSQTAYHV